MPDSASSGPERADERESQFNLGIERPTLKLLLYTDNPRGITDGHDSTDLGILIDHLYAHAPTFAQLKVKWLSRNSSNQSNADYKLNAKLLKEYDQIWFFGIHQMNVEYSNLNVLQGGPQNELEEGEVRDLEAWMKVDQNAELNLGGGVLMTGDHSNEKPVNSLPGTNMLCPDNSRTENFLGLGRALGRCVPRAGMLRQWEGGPTAYPNDSFNTQNFVPGMDPENPQLQIDANPMQLLLRTFDAVGNPAPDGLPHPLFLYKGGSWIRVFPDHAHEGAVIIPEKLDTKVWPKGKEVQPEPRVIARGIDHRNYQLLDILAAYNGDCAGVGRIVADSTWHHYLNENLNEFRSPAPEGSVADQIGQFYGNLAVWLSPRSRRREMAYVMFLWLVNHLFILEELRPREVSEDEVPNIDQVLGIGRAAYSILSRVASPCEIHELLQAVVPDQYCHKFETLYFLERGVLLSLFPSKEVILGYILDLYQQEILKADTSGKQGLQLDVVEITRRGFERAFKGHVERVAQSASYAQKLLNL